MHPAYRILEEDFACTDLFGESSGWQETAGKSAL